jgi:aryl-alcohol dehydrogenase-like predicted oxidoreductase
MGESVKVADLALRQVPYYLLHHPNDGTPISDTMDGIQELYMAGKFEQVPWSFPRVHPHLLTQ